MDTSLEKDLLALASEAAEESDILDYKREFSPNKKAAFWAETVKDIVAFANTAGGILVFGVEDNGSLYEDDCAKLFEFDNADISNQVRKYTEVNFSDFMVRPITIHGEVRPALLIGPVEIPIVFTNVGTYEPEPGKQKTAFSRGTIYFRHGSKSEPATRADIEQFIDRRLEKVRSEWLGNIRKVVEAPYGATVVVASSGNNGDSVQITNDPNAPKVRIGKLSEDFPHTQSAVISLVNEKLAGQKSINTHDIQTIKHCEKIDPDTHPELMHKPHEKSSPQYSPAFAELIIVRIQADADYLQKCRQEWKDMNFQY